MAEVLRAIADLVRIPQRAEYPISPNQRAQLEQGCQKIFEKKVIGHKDFNRFVENMVRLNSTILNTAFGGGISRLTDSEKGFNISFLSAKGRKGVPASILIEGDSQVGGNIQKYRKFITFQREGEKLKPVVTEERKMMDDAKFTQGSEGYVSDEELRKNCVDIFGSYLKSQRQTATSQVNN
jgi:hypothetical protein